MIHALYKALDYSRNDFRLLKLSPTATDPDDPVEATLLECSLDAAPPYWALSYAWGDPNSRQDIIVQGEVVSVTSSLFSALNQIRHYAVPESDFFIWADAICIDQSNNVERSYQVKLMHLIYGQAQLVVVWLGPFHGDSDPAVDLVRAWSQLPDDATADDMINFLQEYPQAFDRDLWRAVKEFTKLPWFTRMWTYQEFVLAQHVTFLRGDREVSADELWNAWSAWDYVLQQATALHLHHDQIQCLARNVLEDFSTLYVHRVRLKHPDVEPSERERDFFSQQSLQEFLHHRKATDPRDKLYSMLAVLPFEKVLIEPDYERPVAEVYIDYAIQTIESSRSLAILGVSGVGIEISSTEEKLNLPSWVPDLRESCKWPWGRMGTIFDATKSITPGFEILSNSNVLCAEGVSCATVSHVVDTDRGKAQEWSSFVRQYDIPNPTGIPQIQAYFRMLITDASDSRNTNGFENEESKEQFFQSAVGFMYMMGRLELSNRPKDELWPIIYAIHHNSMCVGLFAVWLSEYHQVREGMSDEDLLTPFTGLPESAAHLHFPPHYYQAKTRDNGIDELSAFAIQAITRLRNVKFFATEEGYIGLGPVGMRTGDKICLLFGCPFPLLLRQEEDHFLVVGQCYAYGLMQGELVPEIEAGKYTTQKFHLK